MNGRRNTATDSHVVAPRPIRWIWLPYAELAIPQLYDLLALRQAVFIVEQNCPYQDADGLDQYAWHLLGYQGEKLIAYLRVTEPGRKFPEPCIGRVITSPAVRRTGVGRELMKEGIKRCMELYPGQGIRISAQSYLEKFYGEFGFRTVRGPYDEDGIPHLEMLLVPSI
jgi:ElaA protein